MVWRAAILTPQVHYLEETKASRSWVSLIEITCKESQEVFLKLQMDYILMKTGPRSSDDTYVEGTANIYINF